MVLDYLKRAWLKRIVGYDNPRRYWDSRWIAGLQAESETGKTAKEQFATVEKLMAEHSCKNVLEVGCGKATLRNLPDYMGLDFSLQVLLNSGLPKFIYADITRGIPLPTDSKDVVLSRYVLLHIPFSKIEFVVDEICRVAKKLVVLREPSGSKEHIQPHCWRHDLPTLFEDFNGVVVYLPS